MTLFGRIARAGTIILGAASIAAAFIVQGEVQATLHSWVWILSVTTMAAGWLVGLKWPTYIDRRLNITLSVLCTMFAIVWFVMIFTTKSVVNAYWVLVMVSGGVANLFRVSPVECRSDESISPTS